MNSIEFFVPGIPQPGGSKKGFYNRKAGRVVIVEDCKRNKEWRAVVALAARRAYHGEPLTGPVRLNIYFYMPRPKSHYGTGKKSGELKLTAPYFHTNKPDRTKLQRSTEDAMTGIIWRDDTQVVDGVTSKIYDRTPGADIKITELEL